eukprot:UN30520
MVNIYGIEAWFSLMFVDSTIYVACIRDFWEAVVIYEFYRLIMICVGGPRVIAEDLHGNTKQIFPFNWCLNSWDPDELIFWTRSGILQYCMWQVFCGLITFICQLSGVYDEGSMQPDAVYPYVALIITLSQTWAIYCLVLFYHALQHMPADSYGGGNFKKLNALPKFICIKLVVFFIFWQGVGLSVLVYFGIIPTTEDWEPEEISIAIQDCLVCLEMLGFCNSPRQIFQSKIFRISGRTR